MANLTFKERNTLEELFEMSDGYILDFSNSSFARFIVESINIDIYNSIGYEEYCSKANKLRQVWKQEPDNIVGKLTKDLLEYYEDYKSRINVELTKRQIKQLDEMKIVAQRLLGNSIAVTLPEKQEETFQTLMEDINSSLARNRPELVLDRLHTFSTKLLRQICEGHEMAVTNNKGDYLPLHSLGGMLKNYYKDNNIFDSEFIVLAIQNNIDLFDKYNSIRNNRSYAHDNDVLGKIEAEFAVKAMANVINFIDTIEEYRKVIQKSEIIEIGDDDLPF